MEGIELYAEACKRCSVGLYEEYLEYVKEVHLRLKKLPIGGKKWWRLSHKILQKPDVSSRVPPLLGDDGNWAMEEQEKTEVFAFTFRRKWVLPEEEHISATVSVTFESGCFMPIRPKMARDCLKEIDPDSAVGSDTIPSVVLKRMHMLLETPVTKIIRKLSPTVCGQTHGSIIGFSLYSKKD